MADAGSDDRWRRLPNLLTAARVLLVPVILVLVAAETPRARWGAFAVFLAAAASDTVDGFVARRYGGETRWGALADPIADKLLVVGTLAALAALDDVAWWAVGVIAAREVGVTALRVWLLHRRDVVVPANRWGKLKTVSQLAAVAAFLAPGAPAGVRWGLLYLAVAVTVGSGLDYAVKGARQAFTPTGR